MNFRPFLTEVKTISFTEIHDLNFKKRSCERWEGSLRKENNG